MLLDNKTKTEDSEYSTVYDFLLNYIEQGKLDMVTGYFSVWFSALWTSKDALEKVELPDKSKISVKDHIINLIQITTTPQTNSLR